MFKKILIGALLIGALLPSGAFAQGNDTYIVKPNDTLWKIAVKYQIGVKEIIQANSQIPNPDMIYPNQKINIPNIDQTKSVETASIKYCKSGTTKARLEAPSNGLGISKGRKN